MKLAGNKGILHYPLSIFHYPDNFLFIRTSICKNWGRSFHGREYI